MIDRDMVRDRDTESGEQQSKDRSGKRKRGPTDGPQQDWDSPNGPRLTARAVR